MTTIEAAKNIRDQLRAQGTPVPWHECLRWAAACRREASARAEAKRAEWFIRRRQELREETWRQRVRSAPIITESRHAATVAREGGWVIEYCPPIEKDAA